MYRFLYLIVLLVMSIIVLYVIYKYQVQKSSNALNIFLLVDKIVSKTTIFATIK